MPTCRLPTILLPSPRVLKEQKKWLMMERQLRREGKFYTCMFVFEIAYLCGDRLVTAAS
jgi:hypothetical protein